MDATPIIIKKKKQHAHAHHGGSWKVAYADFVTAMMAFFMVMWIMGLSDDTKAQIQGYFNDPVGFIKSQPRSRTVIPIKSVPGGEPGDSPKHQSQPFQDDRQAIKQLKQDLEKALESSPELLKFLEHIDIEITEEGLRIEFIEDKQDFFQSGNAVLKPGAIKVIKALGPHLAASGRVMGIEGHTDSVPFAGGQAGNFRLSSDRANALLSALSATGCRKFKYSKGLADQELRDAEHPTSAINRRVTILLPFVTPPTATIPMPKDAVREMIREAIVPKVDDNPQAPSSMLGKPTK